MTSFFDIKDLSKKDLERIIDDSIEIKKNGSDKILKNNIWKRSPKLRVEWLFEVQLKISQHWRGLQVRSTRRWKALTSYFLILKNFGHENSSWRAPRSNVVYSKIWNSMKIHKNRDIEKIWRVNCNILRWKEFDRCVSRKHIM